MRSYPRTKTDKGSYRNRTRLINIASGRSARKNLKKLWGEIVMGTVKRIKFDSWPDLLEAVKQFNDQGAKTEINGFDDLSENILTVYGEINEYIKRSDVC